MTDSHLVGICWVTMMMLVGEHDDDDDDGDNCDIMQLVQFYPTGVTDIVNGYPAFNYYDNLTINYWDMTYGPTGLLSLYCM